MVLLLFFCSGASALIYEVIWSKSLSLIFGSTVQAQTVVLAVFMGGLALGNRLIGSRSDLLRRPLAAYGYIEAFIGLYAFFFNWIYEYADLLFVKAGSPLLAKPFSLLLLKGTLSLSLLFVPTVLMGGTLPLLAAWLQRQSNEAGRRSTIFYSVNSLGAVFGSFLAGFVLVQAMGLPATLQMTGFANVTIGLAAIALSRRKRQEVEMVAATTPQPTLSDSAETQTVLRKACWLVALSGAVSMGLEVLSSRSLAMVFGASLESFAIVLIAFILGIGLGSALIASRRFSCYVSEKTIFFVLIVAASWIGTLIFGIETLVYIYRELRSGLAPSSMGYHLNQVLTVAASLVVLGVPASLLGAVLPMCMRLVSTDSKALGERIGTLLTWNTLGAVGGVMLTGFVLMPTVGLRGAFGILAGTLCLAAVIIALFNKQRRLVTVASVVLALVFADGIFGGSGWRLVLSSGLFRLREKEVLSEGMDIRRKTFELIFYQDAPDATVSVERTIADHSKLSLRINGKVDATSHGDFSTQCLLAHLPIAIRPESKDVFLVGLGSGVTGGAVLAHPVDRLVVAENCQPVITAAGYFAEFNGGVLTNSRTRMVGEDARTVLKLSSDQYDVIINQPSNPWMAGIGSVFSREFYQICSKRLKPHGVISQWFHVYEMSDEIVLLVLRTFHSVFPYVELWDTGSGDLILLGSNAPFEFNTAAAARLYQREVPRHQLDRIGLSNPTLFWARQIASQKTAFAIAGPGPIQTDAFPVLEYGAPRAFFIGDVAKTIFTFDERTWQSSLASPEKKLALSTFSIDALRSAFLSASVNPEIQSYVGVRTDQGDPNAFVKLKQRGTPSIFRPLSAPRVPLFAGQTSNDGNEAFAQVEAAVFSTNRLQGVQWIEEALKNEFPSEKEGEKFEELTAAAAKECLRLNDSQSARALVKAGLNRRRNSIELNYLARILDDRARN